MKCKETSERLDAYLDGELAPREALAGRVREGARRSRRRAAPQEGDGPQVLLDMAALACIIRAEYWRTNINGVRSPHRPRDEGR